MNEILEIIAREEVRRVLAAQPGFELLPPDVVEARVTAEIRDRRKAAEAANVANGDRVRSVIRKALADLGEALGAFGQTCHGMIPLGPPAKCVAEYLAKTYEKPTAFNISSLSQSIDALIRSAAQGKPV